MSDSVPPSDPSRPAARPEPSPPQVPPALPEKSPEAGRRAALGRFVPHGRTAAWIAAGAAVLVVGGVLTVVAVEHHDGHGRGPHAAARFQTGPGGAFGQGPKGAGPGGGGGLRERFGHPDGPGKPDTPAKPGKPGKPGESGGRAPAPVPSLLIGQAAEKAAAAVPGGKVVGLRVVGQEGGGSAWLAVVLGPDGVRHAVTVSGTDGQITGNTTRGG